MARSKTLPQVSEVGYYWYYKPGVSKPWLVCVIQGPRDFALRGFGVAGDFSPVPGSRLVGPLRIPGGEE